MIKRSNNLMVCFDVETNGFAGMNMFSPIHRVIEFGAKWGHPPTDEFTCVVNVPNLPVHPFSTKIHGISSQDVENSPHNFQDVWQMFKRKCGFEKYETVIMIAHNGRFFDEPMLKMENIPEEDLTKIKWVDTLQICKSHLGDKVKSMSLESLCCHFFDEDIVVEHRASSDVSLLWRLVTGHLCKFYGDDLLDYVCDSMNLANIKFIGFYTRKKLINMGVHSVQDLVEYVHNDAIELDEFLLFKLGITTKAWRQSIVWQLLGVNINKEEDYVDMYLKATRDGVPKNLWTPAIFVGESRVRNKGNLIKKPPFIKYQ